MKDAREKPVRVGLVGVGYWGERVVRAGAVTQELSITQCFARSKENREAFATQHGCRPASSYQEMLEDPDIEGVLLITPNRVHRDQIMLAVEHGKHVFVDKPITATLEEGVEVIDAVERAGLVLAVDQEARREAPLRKLKQLLEQGELGRMSLADANVSSSTGLTIEPGDWRGERAECPGGPLVQIGIHHIDSMQYLLGPITRVIGWQAHRYLDAPIDDTTTTMLEFEKGMLGYLGSCYATAPSAWIKIYGDTAIAHYDRYAGLSVSGKPLHSKAEDWEVPPSSYADPIMMIHEALAEFAHCIRNRLKPEVGGYEALTALAVVLGAVESAQTERPVSIPELLQRAGLDKK